MLNETKVEVTEISPENKEFLENLPNIGKLLVDDSLPVNKEFLHNIDSVGEHEPNWHQFGIITHTKEFVNSMTNTALADCKQWGAETDSLDDMIGNKTKRDLITTASVFHDLGKFARGQKDENGVLEPDYSGHEAKSEEIIRNGLAKQYLLKHNYTEEQIEYIARCAGLHYELGKMRGKAKESDLGYSIAFANSELCRGACGQIAEKNPDFNLEIGLLFLSDSLAKTDIQIDAESDDEIEAKTEEVQAIMQERKLNSKLIGAVKQSPVNIAVAKAYLQGLG